MNLTIILFIALIATFNMTFFSYFVAYFTNQPYEEPYLIGRILKNFAPEKLASSSVLQWSIHYLIGLLFVIIFQILNSFNYLEYNYLHGFLFGFSIGIIGVLGWKFLFKISKFNPKMNYNLYYFQLVIAHIIFGESLIATTYFLHIV